MRKNNLLLFIVGVLVISFAACGPKPAPGRPKPVDRPCWSKSRAEKAIMALAEEYRKDPEKFYANRTCVWAGTWVWPETVGISERHLNLLKKLFYEGDTETREIILNVIFMNIPANKLKSKEGKFLNDLVLLDTELKERKANVPPPSDTEEIIEEYVQPK